MRSLKVFLLLFLPLVVASATVHAGSAGPTGQLRQFEMTIEEVEIGVAPGFKAKVWGFDGQVPGPLIRVQEGDQVEVTVHNFTTLNHTVHWHGMFQTASWQADGVPDVTQKGIEPGESYTYRFIADKTGSLWYHCHVNVAEHVGQRGMWGPIIVDPAEPEPLEERVTKEAVLMFSGWDSSVAQEYGENGLPAHQLDYFSINGRSFPTNQPLRVKEGDVLRLRLFATAIPVAFHLHGHDVLVTHKDGLPLPEPYYADVVGMHPGERYDVIVEMDNPGIWMTHDHVDAHVTNNGKEHGGSMLVVEYEGVEPVDSYMWKDIDYEADFYFSESLEKGPGLYRQDFLRGRDLLDF